MLRKLILTLVAMVFGFLRLGFLLLVGQSYLSRRAQRGKERFKESLQEPLNLHPQYVEVCISRELY